MRIKDLEFQKFIDKREVQKKIKELGKKISQDYEGKTPVFLPILNGSFMFAADLVKQITTPCRVSFVKINSYTGTKSSGQLKTLIGHDESLFNQDIIIVEDIVDSGLTLQKILDELRSLGARSVEAVSLFRKKEAREKNIEVKYVGFDLEEEFILGYGLDFDGLGRNHQDVYKQIDSAIL